jgi:hypothetical protein
MGKIYQENFDITLSDKIISASYVTTDWAKGFSCSTSLCGLCCITELPDRVPRQSFEHFNTPICGHYDVTKKNCKKYQHRPWGCQMYPFIYGVENNRVIISPSLECPATNGPYPNLNVVKQCFSNPFTESTLNLLADVFTNAYLSQFWNISKGFVDELQNKVLDSIDDGFSFPVLSSLSELAYAFADDFFHVNSGHAKFPPMSQIISQIANGKSVICNNFSDRPLMEYFIISGLKVQSTIWNPANGEIKITKPRLIPEKMELEIDNDALALLKDYFSLTFKRPYLSLSAASLTRLPTMMSNHYVGNIVGNFIHLDAAANLFAYRIPNNKVDRTIMREILSFADGCLLSQFRKPRTVLK